MYVLDSSTGMKYMSDPARQTKNLWHSYKSAFFQYLCTGEAEHYKGESAEEEMLERWVRSILLRSKDFSAIVEFTSSIQQSDTLKLTWPISLKMGLKQ